MSSGGIIRSKLVPNGSSTYQAVQLVSIYVFQCLSSYLAQRGISSDVPQNFFQHSIDIRQLRSISKRRQSLLLQESIDRCLGFLLYIRVDHHRYCKCLESGDYLDGDRAIQSLLTEQKWPTVSAPATKHAHEHTYFMFAKEKVTVAYHHTPYPY